MALPRVLRSGRIFRVWQKTHCGWEFEALFQFSGGKIHYIQYKMFIVEQIQSEIQPFSYQNCNYITSISWVYPAWCHQKKQLKYSMFNSQLPWFPQIYIILHSPEEGGVIIIIWNLKGVQKTMGKTHAKIASLGWVGELDPHPGWRWKDHPNLGPCHVGFICFREFHAIKQQMQRFVSSHLRSRDDLLNVT